MAGLTEDDGVVEALATLYRRGESMEFIAEAMDLPLAYVSQVVALLGLGEERYKGHFPHKGSAPVLQASAVAATQAGRFGKYGR